MVQNRGTLETPGISREKNARSHLEGLDTWYPEKFKHTAHIDSNPKA